MTAPAWIARFAQRDPVVERVAAPIQEAPPPEEAASLSESDRAKTLALLRNLALKGFLLHLEGDDDQIAVDSEREVPPELLGRLKERKPAILAVLKAQVRAADALKARDDIACCQRTVCIETIWERVWVVPQQTGAVRVEVTWAEIHADPWGAVDRAHQLAAAVDLFDGKLIVEQHVEKNVENSEAKS